MEVLQSKHPEQATQVKDTFVQCANLPNLFFVDIINPYNQRVTNKLSGGPGPKGLQSSKLQKITSERWKSYCRTKH